MANLKTIYKVVLASPSDVCSERDAVAVVIQEINELSKSGCVGFDLYRWETDSFPRFHTQGPQGAIDEDLGINEADVFIGIFHLRFGSPVMNSKSGTEHELRQAIEAFEKQGSPTIKLYFKNPGTVSPEDFDENKVVQYQQLKMFKAEMLPKGIIGDFIDTTDFRDKIRRDLLQFIHNVPRNTLMGALGSKNGSEITIENTLFEYLEKSKEECRKRNEPYQTAEILQVLISIPDSLALRIFNDFCDNTGKKLGVKYLAKLSAFVKTKKTDYSFTDFDWGETEWINAAQKCAHENGSKTITQKYLLLGILNLKTNTINFIKNDLNNKFNDLLDKIRMTMDSGNRIPTPIFDRSVDDDS